MLASSSRNALKAAQSRISQVVADTGAPAASSSLSKCVQQQQRNASTAQASVRSDIFGRERGQEYRRNGLRHGPYSFQPDPRFRGTSPRTNLARYNMELGRLIGRKLSRATLQVCKKMKEEGIQPDSITYNFILEACAEDAFSVEARAAFEDMIALGLPPSRQHFHHLLHAVRALETSEMWELLELMRHYNIVPNESTYEIIILRYTDTFNLELALQFLAEIGARGLSPTLKTAESIITTASKVGFPRLALDLAEAFEETSVRRLEGTVWVDCLISSSDALYKDGVLRTWQKVVHELEITPDEGCCLQVLHTAGRHGLSALALDVLRILSRIGIAWQEYHFAPVIDALCKEKNIKEALAMLDLIRSHSINPVAETAYPIFAAISTDTEAVDEAWGHLESLREEGRTIDVTALNVIIQASVALGDLQRAVGTYKAADQLGVSPNVDTYNLLISGCIVAQHRQLGDRLLSEMKEAKVKPDVRTYERLIILCLTQANYEDAFFYLEEMKAEGHLPPLAVYEGIIRKCVQVGDTRSKLALEELLECGYTVSEKLKTFMESGGQREITEEEDQPIQEPDRRKERKEYKERKRIFYKGIKGPR